MIRHRLVFSLFWLPLVTACVTVGPGYTDSECDPSKAVVLVYRLHPPVDLFLMNTYAYAHAPDLYMGENKLISLNVNAYTYVEIEPGTHLFSVREKLTGLPISQVEVDAKAGQKYYLRYNFRFGLVMDEADMSFKMVPGPIGEKEITETRYVSPADQ